MTAIIAYLTLILIALALLIGILFSLLNLALPSPKRQSILHTINQLTAFGLTFVIFILLAQLLLQNYHFVYVAKTTDNTTPILLRIAALWANQEGSILFWIALVAYVNLIIQNQIPSQSIRRHTVSFIIQNIPVLLFLIYLILAENPFYRVWIDQADKIWVSIFNLNQWQPFIPTDGNGLNPLLHHYAMIIHPPILYLGFITMWIPTVLTLTHLITNKPLHPIQNKLKKWTIISFSFLTLGIFLGSRWAFDLLSWGGYWSWDVVEVASLLPWLVQLVLLHTLFRAKSKQNPAIPHLILLTNFFITFEIFITRAGVVNSVHAFAQSDQIIFFVLHLAFALIFLLLALIKTLPHIEIHLPHRKSKKRFLAINLLLITYSFFLFLGILYPILQRTFNQVEVIIEQSYYQTGTLIFWSILFLLFAIDQFLQTKTNRPWLAFLCIIPIVFLHQTWSTKFLLALAVFNLAALTIKYIQRVLNTRFTFAIYLIHAAVIILSIGIIGMEKMSQQHILPITTENIQIPQTAYQLQLNDIIQTERDQKTTTTAQLTLFKNSKILTQVAPSQTLDQASMQSFNFPAQKRTLTHTLAISIAGYDQQQNSLLLLIQLHQFAPFIWASGILLTLSVLLLLSDKRQFQRETTHKKATKENQAQNQTRKANA